MNTEHFRALLRGIGIGLFTVAFGTIVTNLLSPLTLVLVGLGITMLVLAKEN